MTTSKKHYINFNLDDNMKEFIIKNLKIFQTSLENRNNYSSLHFFLDDYFKKNELKKPCNADYFAFILISTYSEEKIKTLKSVYDIKFCNTENDTDSDFECIEMLSKLYDDDNYDNVNFMCICSHPIQNIYLVKNKYTGIIFQVGSECITSSGIVSKKKITDLLKEKKERKKEREEGLPEGHYENERKSEKEKKIIEKDRKELEKKFKKRSKLEYGLKIGTCIFCNKDCIYNADNYKLCMCSTCIPEEDKKFKYDIRWKLKWTNISLIQKTNSYYMDDCSNCEKEFISKDERELCGLCIESWKIKTCRYPRCNIKFCVDINEDDEYCLECDEKITKCSDCPIKIYKEEAICQNGRCKICHRRFLDKKVLKCCDYCEEEFEVYEKDKWRTCCKNCYKDNIEQQKCNMCSDIFKKLPHETWKKTCTTCYYKSKQTKQSVSSY